MTEQGATLEEKYKLMIAAFRDLGETVKEQQARITKLEEEIEQMVPKGWEGLLTILNEVYPASIFGGADDDWEDQTRDLGPRLTTLAHHLDAERKRVERLERFKRDVCIRASTDQEGWSEWVAAWGRAEEGPETDPAWHRKQASAEEVRGER